MADIFVSYATNDRERVRELVAALEDDGFTVWWDRSIHAGTTYDREIEAAIDSCDCMVVVWSASSVESEYVRSEVEEGARRQILVPVLFDEVLPPLAHRRRQAANLIGWSGARDGEYTTLIKGIRSVQDGSAAELAPVEPVNVGSRQKRSGVGLLVAVLAAGVLIGASLSFVLDESPSQPAESVKRATIPVPDGEHLALAQDNFLGVGQKSLALSPDGTHLAFVVVKDDRRVLRLRGIGEFGSTLVEGTEGASAPFFSPDGQWLAFFTDTELKKVSLRGGAPQTIAEVKIPVGGAWGPDDVILVAEGEGFQLVEISAEDGAKEVVFTATQTMWPSFLPGGRQVLLWAAREKRIVIYDRDTRMHRTLIEGGAAATYLPTGHIVYARDGTLMSAKLDLDTLAIVGPPVPIADDVLIELLGQKQVSVANDGTLAYVTGPDVGISTPVWRERNGAETDSGLPPQRYGTFDLSPDGTRLAFLIDGANSDLWEYEFDRETAQRRVTTGGGKLGAVWSPAGEELAFSIEHIRDFQPGLFAQRRNAAQAKELIGPDPGGDSHWANDWGSNGLLLFNLLWGPTGSSSIWVLPMDGGEAEPVVQTDDVEWGGTWSPDGRYFAYTSDVSGDYQVYVKTYPTTDWRETISVGYGEEPIWSGQGDEIFYRRGNEWMSVPVTTDPEFSAGIPKVLFEGPYVNVMGISYAVSPDAQRFLVLRSPQPVAREIRLVTNWFSEVTQSNPP